MGVFIEIMLTLLLVFAIFGIAVDPRAPKIGGFGIGLAVCADILMGGSLTGAAMNPACTFGTLIGGLGDTADLWSQHWLYWVGPVVGHCLRRLSTTSSSWSTPPSNRPRAQAPR